MSERKRLTGACSSVCRFLFAHNLTKRTFYMFTSKHAAKGAASEKATAKVVSKHGKISGASKKIAKGHVATKA